MLNKFFTRNNSSTPRQINLNELLNIDKTLIKLNFSRLANPTIDNIINIFKKIPSTVVTLDLSGNFLYKKSINFITRLLTAIPIHIVSLDLNNNWLSNFSPEDIKIILAAIPSNITTLNLSEDCGIQGYAEKTFTSLIQSLGSLPRTIKDLDFKGNINNNSKNMQNLVKVFKSLDFLNSITLGDYEIFGELFITDKLYQEKINILKNLPPMLTKFTLIYHRKGVQIIPCAQVLIEIFKNFPSSLRSLNISYGLFEGHSEQGLEEIFQNLTSLKTLRLVGTCFDPRSICGIAKGLKLNEDVKIEIESHILSLRYIDPATIQAMLTTDKQCAVLIQETLETNKRFQHKQKLIKAVTNTFWIMKKLISASYEYEIEVIDAGLKPDFKKDKIYISLSKNPSVIEYRVKPGVEVFRGAIVNLIPEHADVTLTKQALNSTYKEKIIDILAARGHIYTSYRNNPNYFIKILEQLLPVPISLTEKDIAKNFITKLYIAMNDGKVDLRKKEQANLKLHYK